MHAVVQIGQKRGNDVLLPNAPSEKLLRRPVVQGGPMFKDVPKLPFNGNSRRLHHVVEDGMLLVEIRIRPGRFNAGLSVVTCIRINNMICAVQSRGMRQNP